MIKRAVEILRDGGLVAFPTETVYGLGADATNSSAVQKIFRAKGRPPTNPLIVHVADIETAKRFTAVWSPIADNLARHFWPGPLTLVLPRSPLIATEVTGGGNTVGIRVPDHPLALQLLRAFGGAIAAPSANRANHISPTCAADVKAELGNLVDLILDGGTCSMGIESTVIDLTAARARILRPGGITQEQIQQRVGPVDLFTGSVNAAATAQSPGQQARHYSPVTPAFCFERSQRDQVPKSPTAAYLLMSNDIPLSPTAKPFPMSNDPALYARQLYHTLRVADQSGCSAIYIELPPNDPAWIAVRDRLMRAAKTQKENFDVD